MWQARRLAKQYRGSTMLAVFRCWIAVCRYIVLHRQIKQVNRQNKRFRLTQFLEESVDLVLKHKAFEWHRHIRQISPKQPFRKIQMYDDYGHPLSPCLELQQIVQYFTDLFADIAFEPPRRPALQVPFTVDELIAGLSRLPMTKALAPEGIPAIVWKEFAPALGPLISRSIENTWNSSDALPPEHWSAGWLHLLAKPGKACNKPSALRPICLQHPLNKVVSGILIQ